MDSAFKALAMAIIEVAKAELTEEEFLKLEEEAPYWDELERESDNAIFEKE